jgi:hypothetical protein
MRHTMKIMDRSGHGTVEWDTQDAASVAQAEAIFTRLQASRFTTYAVRPEDRTDGELIRTFDADADIIAAIPLQGG